VRDPLGPPHAPPGRLAPEQLAETSAGRSFPLRNGRFRLPHTRAGADSREDGREIRFGLSEPDAEITIVEYDERVAGLDLGVLLDAHFRDVPATFGRTGTIWPSTCALSVDTCDRPNHHLRIPSISMPSRMMLMMEKTSLRERLGACLVTDGRGRISGLASVEGGALGSMVVAIVIVLD
jgi:hypothetical protein